MSAARKQKRLSVEEKCKILKKLDEGVLANRLSMDFNVSEAAISKIKKNKAKIHAAVAGTYDKVKRKTLHKAEYVDLENRLYKWFLDQRQRNCPISGPILKAKAMELFGQIYPNKNANDFRASQGWFTKFKRRYGIRILKVCGEILSSNPSTITPFINGLREKMLEMEIGNEQLYNADESGLFFRCLPQKTYVGICEKTALGRKIRKERITFMLCANAEGTHKLKPLVIGKAAKPRCFLNFKNPLDYDHSANAWMTAKIFKTWFHTKFVKEVRRFSAQNNLRPKAILLLDNCSAHLPIEELSSNDGKFFCMLLPANVTAVVQPMDQNPIKVTKLSYRNKLLASIVAQEGQSIHELLQKHDLRYAMLLLNQAWNECSQNILQKAWHKLLNWDDNQYDDEDDIPLSVLFPQEPFYNRVYEETQQLLRILAPDCTLSSEEITAWNADSLDENETETSTDQVDDNVSEALEFVPYNDAICAVNTLIKWNEYNTNFSNKHISNLLELRSDIIKVHSDKRLHQNKVTDYFNSTNTL